MDERTAWILIAVGIGITIFCIYKFGTWSWGRLCTYCGVIKVGFVKKHPFWTALIVLVCLLLLPEILGIVKLVAIGIAAGVDGAWRGTPRSAWGMLPASRTTTSTKPWAKSVGGPLQWSAGARVEQRARITNERVDADGVCFAGVIAPATWVDKRFAAFHGRNDWGAYLTDRTTIKTMPRSEFIQIYGTAEKKKGVAILHLPNLSARCEEILHLGNSTGKSASSAPVLSEHYLQLVGNGPRDITIETTRQTKGVSEYIADVDGEEITIVLPREHWKWLWIVPVHHIHYQSRLLETVVPAEGLLFEEAQAAVQASDKPALQKLADRQRLLGKGYRQEFRFQSIILSKNDSAVMLPRALLLRREEVQGNHIKVRLNIPIDEELAMLVKPAKIVVGIQQ